MASEIFFQACQEGNVEKVVEQIESVDGLDINGKDGYGMTALAYGARNGHFEVVRQLLSRGADRTEVLEQGYGRNYPDIAQVLMEGTEERGMHYGGQEEGEQQGMAPHQMQDGAGYMNGVGFPPQGYPMMPGYGAPGQQYYYDGMHGPNGPGRRPSHQQGHAKKDSSLNLPPPDIARLIPCRFFPNCKYGDKCLFAHPIMPNPSHNGSPLSPSMSQSAMQPVFYPQIPPGYPYPGPYGAGPHQPFYAPMGPLNASQTPYGVPTHFSQSQPQHQLHMGSTNQHSSAGSESAPVNDNEATPAFSQSSQVPLEQTSIPEIEKLAQEGMPEKERDATATPPQQDEVGPLGSEEKEGKVIVEEGDEGNQDAQGKPVHRRQSFNSFLHHHAIPFQPSFQPGPEVGMMAPMQPYPQRMGPKNRRMQGSGHNGFVGGGKRMYGDRPACTFFAGGKCKFGDECRFPHVLPDGTDARPMQAQQRQMYAAQYGGAGSAPSRSAVGNGVNGGVNNGVPLSAPTGPQAEKKTSEEQQSQEPLEATQQQEQNNKQQQQQQSQQPPQSNGKPASPTTSIATTNGAGGGSQVVRSNPSKTSTQAATSSSGRGSSNKKNSSSTPAQRIPTVNDFPALAVSSPNLNGSAASIPLSPSLQAQAQAPLAPTPSTSNNNNDSLTSPKLNGSSAVPATKVNFSAILSAPAPVKARVSAEASSSSKSNGTTEEGETKEDEPTDVVKVNGDEKTKTAAKGNGSKDGKSRGKEVKGSKVDSYKSVASAVKTSSNNAATPSEEDDFQLVNRSRASNKRGSSNPTTSSEGFATQAKAVAA